MQEEMNILASFEATAADLHGAMIHICAADFYRLYVNGKFVAFGPARAARGYTRADRIDLSPYHSDDGNAIQIQVMHYRCRNFISPMQPGFLLCEVERNGEVLLATGYDFNCFLDTSRVQKVPRYSYQRHFEEVWDLGESCRQVPVETVSCPTILDRRAPYPHYEDILLYTARSKGQLAFDPEIVPNRDFYSIAISNRWGRFPREEEVTHPYEWVQSHRQNLTDRQIDLPVVLHTGEYAVFDLGHIETGFIMLNAIAQEDTNLIVAFSEDSPGDEFAFTNMHVHNVVEVTLPAGQQEHFLSFEPYVFRYAMVALRSGCLMLDSFGVKTFIADVTAVKMPDIADEELRSVYEAAVRTYTHNAVDAFIDCPSRERAGWLCDSYFTAKSEYALFGDAKVEDAFLENFRLFDGDEGLPKGMLPI
jgi:alpha-L-rhamnosidase